MVNITKISGEIVERLKSLEPDKIILFGSYAYGNPTEEIKKWEDYFYKVDILQKGKILYE